MDTFYRSPYSIPGTTHGQNSEYARRRTDDFFRCYADLAGDWMPESVLEIGCQAGYLLNEFRKRGAKRLTGIEPGNIPPFICENGKSVDVRRGFLSEDILAGERFDLVYCLFVLEHIDLIDEFLKTAVGAMNEKGKMLLGVPNEFFALKAGNIGMPIHQHYNYFTPASLRILLRRHNLVIKKFISKNTEMLYVLADRNTESNPETDDDTWRTELTLLVNGFGQKVDSRLTRIKEILAHSRTPVGLYGANSSITNIFSWIPDLADKDLIIFDSDSQKWGERLSGVPFPVEPPSAIDRVADVIVVPYRLQNEIVQYIETCSTKSKPVIHRLYPEEI